MEEEHFQDIHKESEIVNFGKFNIFLLTKTAQNSYGIKGGDYARYRRYCSHKVFKLRHNLGIKLGTKNKYLRKDIANEKPNDSKTLQVLLFNSQKNWALANETKFSQNRKASQKSRARFVSIKKFKKALLWARKLRKICLQKTESLTQLQAHAYELYLQGLLQFEKQVWAAAQGKLIACRQIMADLVRVSDSLSERVFKQKIDQIEQTIKFCNFKMSKGKQLTITEIVDLRKGGDATLSDLIDSLAQKRLSQIKIGDNSGQIHFGNERYPIKQSAIIQQKAKIEASQANLQQIKKKGFANLQDDKLYEQLLSLYSGVVIQIQEAIKLCNSERQDSKKKQKYTVAEMEILRKVGLLFQEIKIKVIIDRNLTIFRFSNDFNRGRKSTPQTISKLLTTTSSLFNELAQVIKQKGLVSNTFEIEHIQAIDAKNFYLRAVRLLFVGQVYSNNGKLRQAYGLWSECQRSLKILLSKEEMNENKDDEKFIGSLIPLNRMMEMIRSHKIRSVIQNYESEQGKKEDLNKKLNQVELTEQKAQNAILQSITLQNLLSSGQTALSLEQISKIPIIQLPGRPQPIPTRPIFFDLFYNDLQYPSIESKLKQVKGKTNWWGRIFK